MNLNLSAPSKTFLIGEYSVLVGGPALVLNTKPRFKLLASQGVESVEGIPARSPAAGWLEQRSPLLRDWNIEFVDPHQGRGGFGASGAQFLLVHAFTTFLQSSVSRAVEGYDLKALWNDFQVLGGGGSGADVLAQVTGQVALVDVASVDASVRAWPFADLGFAIVRTENKVATHEHLRDLNRVPLAPLKNLAADCVEKFVSGGSAGFLAAAQSFADRLEALGLQAPATLKMLQEFRAKSWCRLAKGCGALGADTILVLFDQANRAAALSEVQAIATDAELTQGLQMNWSWT